MKNLLTHVVKRVLIIICMASMMIGGIEFMSQDEASAAQFKSANLFPGWKDESGGGVKGIIGVNAKNVDTGDEFLDRGKETAWLLAYIPQLINILIKLVAPIVAGMFIYAGLRMIYAGDDEEEITAAKTFFGYAIWGIIIVAISFSLMKAIYFILV